MTLVKDVVQNKTALVQETRENQAAEAERRKQKSAARKKTATAQEVVLEEPDVFEEQTKTTAETVQSNIEFENQVGF